MGFYLDLNKFFQDHNERLDREILGPNYKTYVQTGGRNHSRTWKAGLWNLTPFYCNLRPKKGLTTPIRMEVTKFLNALELATNLTI